MEYFNFGQYRKKESETYIENLDRTIEKIETKSPVSDKIIFLDSAIALEGDNLLFNLDEHGQQKSYYLRVKIFKQDSEQNFYVKLKNTNIEEDNIQNYGEITVPVGDSNDYSIFDFVFTPNQTYNKIIFELERTSEDYNRRNIETGFYGRTSKINIETLGNIKNIIKSLDEYQSDNIKKLIQIGVQSVPGLLMCINGEPIKVGRTGIYEINNGINITFIGFIIESKDENKKFILDYRY